MEYGELVKTVARGALSDIWETHPNEDARAEAVMANLSSVDPKKREEFKKRLIAQNAEKDKKELADV